MATTINFGYASSPKLTANIADHADVYGGRALVFDGVVDYLNCGSASSIDNIWAGGGTLSAWIYPNSDGESNLGMIAIKRSGSSSGWFFCLNDESGGVCDLRFYTYRTGGHGWQTTAREITINAWNHVVVTYDSDSASNTPLMYINGKSVAFSSIATGSGAYASDASDTMYIGGESTAYNFDGKMCDFKIFNTALTEAQVQELYTKPENTPNAVQDNLVAWYPMIEGNPESPQSIVYDHSEKGLSSEKFGTNDNDWDDSGSNIDYSNGIISYTGSGIGNASVRYDGTTYGAFTFETDKLYKIVFTVSTATQARFKMQTSGSIIFLSSTLYSSGTYTRYIKALSTYNGQGFVLRGETSGANFDITSISLKEVQMGNHATTNFFGDDLVTNGTFDTDANWTKGTGWTIDVLDSNKAECDGTQTGNTNLQQNDLFTVGKTYQITFDLTRTAGNFRLLVGSSGSSGYYTTDATHTYTGVATGNAHLYLQGDVDFVGTVDNVVAKEVGISSSGFDTAVNEPVVPQVPLMRYNQKMLFDGANTYLNPLLSTLSLTDDWSISVWFVANSRSGNQSIIAQSASSSNRLGITINSGGNVIASMYDGSAYVSKSSTAVSVSTMNHVVFTNSNKTVNLYLNGVAQTGGTNAGLNSGGSFTIGRNSLGSGAYFDGTIDDVSIFNTELTQTQVQELFNDGVALDATTHSKANDYLLGYWRNDGVTTWTDRGDIQAIGFDGADDVVLIEDDGSFDFGTNDYTMVAWAKTSSSTDQAILAQGQSGTHPLKSMIIYSTGHFRGNIEDSSGNYVLSTADGGIWDDGNWHHFAIVFKYGDKMYRYVDGENVGTNDSISSVGSTDSSLNVSIGAFFGGSSYNIYPFNGQISQCAVYSSALSADDILGIYNLGRRNADLSVSYPTNLVGYWFLNPTHSNPDLTGADKILDRSGNGNHGTQNGGVNFLGTNDGNVIGSPDSITIREGLNQNRDGLGFYFTNPSSNVLRLNSNQSEYIRVPNSSVFNFSGDFAIEFWMKHEGNATNQYICSMGEGNSSTNTRFAIFLDSNDQIKASYDDGSSVVIATYDTGSEGAVVDNLWHHWVVNFEKSDKIKIYLDGDSTAKAQSSSIASLGGLNTSLDLIVGALYHGNGGFFNGLLDELRFYSKILSADEINKNYKHQKGKHKND